MLGETSNALILGSLALSLQARITVFTETGELAGRYSPEVNLSVLRRLPKLHLIKIGDHTHGTWPTPQSIDSDSPHTALVPSHPERQKLTAYWKHTSNLPTRIEFDGVQVGQWKDHDVKIVSLNVDGLDGGKFEELLAYMDTQGIGVLVLQDTRCAQTQARYYGEQLKKRLGRQAKLFNVEGAAPLNAKGEKKAVRVGGQMFLTDHRLGIYTHDFSPDPTGLGVLSSITITSREAGFGLKIIGTYWPPDNALEGSLGRQLAASPNFLQLASQQHLPLHPKDYLQICIDKISDSYCAQPHRLAILAGDLNSVWDPIPGKTLGAHGKGLQAWARESSWRHPTASLGLGESPPEQWISHFSRDGTQGTSWIDHLLIKGSANINPTYLGIEHSGFWLNISDHRPAQ